MIDWVNNKNISNSLQLLLYFWFRCRSKPFPKTYTKQTIKPSLSVFSNFRIINWWILYLQVQSLLILIFISIFKNISISVVYFFTIISTSLLNLCWLDFTWLHALIILLIKVKVDFHSLLSFWRIYCSDFRSEKNLFFYHLFVLFLL